MSDVSRPQSTVTTTPTVVRDRIVAALCTALEPRSDVLAGWEGGSAAFGVLDAYSDIDMNFLVADDASFESVYACAEHCLAALSPVVASHAVPPGRYYKLRDVGEFLLVDLCLFRVSAAEHNLEVERHGRPLPLFDKGTWLEPRFVDEQALAHKRQRRLEDLWSWFPISQSFVRKAILRGKQAEAVAAFWSYTLRPLAELLRMRYCPLRWDFGVRYIDRDLPTEIYDRFCDLAVVVDLEDLDRKLARATAWGSSLLRELRVAHAG